MKQTAKKPKIKNWLILIFFWIPIVLLFIWCAYLQFYKSYPEIPEPISIYPSPVESTSLFTSTIGPEALSGASFRIPVTTLNDDTEISRSLYVTPTDSDKLFKVDDSISEDRKKQLEVDIDNLEFQKTSLLLNISELQRKKDELSKISHDMQVAIIKFVEKNRVRDMLASAFVGALISALLTFILSRRVIRKAIDNWLWKNIQRNRQNAENKIVKQSEIRDSSILK